MLRLAVLPRFAAEPPRAVPRLAVDRFAVERFADERLAPARFAPPRLAAVLRPRDDFDADLRALEPERRELDALFAPEREDERLDAPPDERLRAPPELLFRPAERVPLLRFVLLRDVFVAMCGLLRGGCAANVASSAHMPQ